jgi:hypothetical protein
MADSPKVAQEVEELTEQFYVTLRAEVARLSAQDEGRSPKSFQQIQELLSSPRAAWSDAYQIEQLMIDLYDERTLEIELQSRLLEGDSNLRPPLIAQYNKLASNLKAPADRRALLARLVNDLQWRYTVNEVKRSYSKEITKTTGLIFMVAIALFAGMVVSFALFGSTSDFTRDSILLLIAALAGAWGASFSMLSSVKGRLEEADLNDLKLMGSAWILWSRPLIGVGAAGILYFFMASGLLSGSAFPTFATRLDSTAGQAQPVAPAAPAAPATPGAPATPDAAATAVAPATPATPAVPTPRTQLSLLIVWCFLAGFSERLVPALLAKTEDRAQAGGGAGASDRFKPGPITSDESDAAAKAAPPSSSPASQPSPRPADAPSDAAPT